MKSTLFLAEDEYGNAVLNFNHSAEDEFDLYARAFHRSGVAIAERMFSAPGYNDLDACPLIFLYRQALELYLKAIARLGQTIFSVSAATQEITEKDLFGHNLSRFVLVLRKVFDQVGWKWDLDIEGIRSFEDLETLLNEWDVVDQGSYTFRYPLDTKGKDSVRHHFVVNVPSFCSQMDALLKALDSACVGLKEIRYSMVADHSDIGLEE